MKRKSNSRFSSLTVFLMLLVEIITYCKIYLAVYLNSYGRFESTIFFVFPPIICMGVFILFFITSLNKNKSVILILLSMLASWAPLMLVPAFVDMTILKMTFSQSIVVQLLPFISILIGVLSNIKYISYIKLIYKSKKISSI